MNAEQILFLASIFEDGETPMTRDEFIGKYALAVAAKEMETLHEDVKFEFPDAEEIWDDIPEITVEDIAKQEEVEEEDIVILYDDLVNLRQESGISHEQAASVIGITEDEYRLLEKDRLNVELDPDTVYGVVRLMKFFASNSKTKETYKQLCQERKLLLTA